MRIMISQLRRFLLLFLFFNLVWSQCGNDCLDCQSSMGVCYVCAGSFESDVFGKCHANTVQKCVTYGPTGDCLRCQSTYTLQNKACIKDYTGCTSLGSQNQCYECGFGRQLQGQTCKGVINCATYQQNCTKCSDGYQLVNNICRDSSTNCADVRSTDGLCTKCNNGYFLSGYKCYQNAFKNQRCYILLSNEVCLLCKSGFNQINGKCVLSSETQTISSVISNFGSASSDFGFGSSGSSQTQTSTSFSSSFSSSTGAISISGPTTTNMPSSTTSFSTTGSTQNSFGSSGSSIDNSFGSTGSTGSFGDFNSGNSGFTSGGTQTTQSILNCEVPNPSGGCLICVYGYFPQNNACIGVSNLCDGHNVQTGDCFACKFSLSLQNGKCIDANCASTSNNVCQQCVTNYKVNQNGVCTLYDPNCLLIQSGRCQQCAKGYYIQMAGTCKKLPENCNVANMQTGDCLQCAQGFKIQRAGSPCVRQLPNNCQSANSANECVICNNGYQTNQGKCIEKINIANCNVVDSVNKRCVTCADRYYPQQNVCASVSTTCNTYNPINGLCTTCRTGNTLQANGSCTTTPVVIPVITPVVPPTSTIPTIPTTPTGTTPSITPTPTTPTTSVPGTTQTIPTSTQISDANCRSYNGAICIMCSNRYYVGSQGKCIPVNPLCKENNPQGDCTSCYPGYVIQSGRCIIGQATDPNCKTSGSQGCNQCYAGFFLNSADRVCKRVNPLCRTSNPNTGACLSCYPGYGISTSTGNCEISFKDPNCRQFKADNTCAQCAVRFYVGSSGTCVAVNPLCKQYSLVTGACTTCYPGYRASNNTCVVGANNNDVNCKTFQGNLCTACFTGFFISIDGNCKQVSPLCKTFSNTTGACTSCYQGYELSGQNCVEATSRDQNCKIFNSSNQNFCMQCYPGFVAINGSCRDQNPLCRTINSATGACNSCWQGYVLSGQNCVVQQQNSQTSSSSGTSDPYCIKFTNSVCSQCANGFYYNSREVICKQMDPLCRTSDNQTGFCLSCYPGYSLANNKCDVAQAIQIPNCNIVSSSGSCLQCFSGYYVSNNSCQSVSILCATYSQQTGQCLSCISQHFLQDGICIYPGIFDSHCIRYQNSFCSQCQPSYYLSSYTCQPVDPNCSSFNYSTNTCQACFNGRIPQGVSCL